MKHEAQPRHRQDSQEHKDALGRTTPKGAMADSASPHEGCTGSLTDTGRVKHLTTDEKAHAALCRTGLEAWRGSCMAMPDRMSVNRPS